MSNLSLMTAIQCSAGNQRYYLGAMSVAQLVREVVVDDDFAPPASLALRRSMKTVARELGRDYPSCFVVGVHAGGVRFTPFELTAISPLYAELGQGAGILTLETSDGLFALSGRSLLLALKRQLQRGTVSAKDEYGVQIVALERLPISVEARGLQCCGR